MTFAGEVNAMTAACMLAITTLYDSQPLLPLIGAIFCAGESLASQTSMLGQLTIRPRKDAGLTQQEPAKRAKRLQSFVAQYEDGERRWTSSDS